MAAVNILLRIALTSHGLRNVAQSVYSISYPAHWETQARGFFQGSHAAVVQSVGKVFPK